MNDSISADSATLPQTTLADQPIERVTRDGVEYTLLGTAHVSRASVAAVRELIAQEDYDAIAVELCDSRFRALRDHEAWRNLDLLQIIRQGKAGMVAANLALSAYQRRLAEQFGIEPGAEMKAAAELADERQKPIWLIDREVSITLKRTYRSVGLLQRFGILSGLIASLSRARRSCRSRYRETQAGRHHCKAHSMSSPSSPNRCSAALIGERDHYMVARLHQEPAGEQAKAHVRRVLAVIGAGHLAGMSRELTEHQDDPATLIDAMKTTPPPARWPKWPRARRSRVHHRGDRLCIHARREPRRRCAARLGTVHGRPRGTRSATRWRASAQRRDGVRRWSTLAFPPVLSGRRGRGRGRDGAAPATRRRFRIPA